MSPRPPCGTPRACRPGPRRRSKRLLTFTLETELRFAHPHDVHAFTDALTAAVEALVARYDSADGRPYRVVALGHPAPAETGGTHD